MRNSAASYCLIVATASLVAAPVIAQEALLNEPTASTPQQRFVSDKLVLNVYTEPVQGSTRVATIQTGDAVEELERSGTQVRVRLPDGREGWVGANYLVSDAPAIVQLRELQRQQPAAAPRIDKASVEEIAQLKKENATLRGQVNELQSRVAAPPVQTEQPVESEPEPAAPVVESAAFAGSAPSGGILGWVIAVMFVGAASFAGGYQTLARRLRKKFGGLKIY